jgi:hypothetical protein
MSVKLRKNNNFFHFSFAFRDIPCDAVFTVGGESRTTQPPKFNTNKDGSHGQQEEVEEEEDGQEVIRLARVMRAV